MNAMVHCARLGDRTDIWHNPARTPMTTEASDRVTRRPGGIRDWAAGQAEGLFALVDLVGETLIAAARLLRGRGREGRAVFAQALQQYGLESLPVVGLIAFVGGLVLTLLGLKELGKAGVEGMAPKLVGIVILREIGPLITGVALAGRVASSVAAETALAKTRGEAATLRRRGLRPAEVLVAPRVLALLLAGPLLVAYADALALLGSGVFATLAMNRPGSLHVAEVWSGLSLKHAVAALVKGAGFGFVVGLAGAWHGLRARGPADVGARVRGAVVSAVVAVGITETLLILVFKRIRF
jgi:phospholipid/cholesterol/gamma-HCH transport system permease protein